MFLFQPHSQGGQWGPRETVKEILPRCSDNCHNKADQRRRVVHPGGAGGGVRLCSQWGRDQGGTLLTDGKYIKYSIAQGLPKVKVKIA